MPINYKDVMNELDELSSDFTLVYGNFDLIKSNNYFTPKKESIDFFIKAGNGNEDLILESIFDFEFQPDREGFYQFKLLMTYDGGQYDSYGRCECRSFMEIQHCEIDFICSFEAREREMKINDLLGDFFNL